FFETASAATGVYTLSLHDALPILMPAPGDIAARFFHFRSCPMSKTSLDKSKIKFLLLEGVHQSAVDTLNAQGYTNIDYLKTALRSEEHTSELQSRENLVCRLLLEK